MSQSGYPSHSYYRTCVASITTPIARAIATPPCHMMKLQYCFVPSFHVTVVAVMLMFVVSVDSFSLNDRCPNVISRRTPPSWFLQRSYSTLVRASTDESADANSPNSNTTSRRTRKEVLVYPPSSRSTAVFAMYDSLKRRSTIALRILENDPTYKSLENRDRAFARLLLTTAERRQGQIDKVIRKLAHQQTKTKKVRNI
jgi:hypothetical protein